MNFRYHLKIHQINFFTSSRFSGIIFLVHTLIVMDIVVKFLPVSIFADVLYIKRQYQTFVTILLLTIEFIFLLGMTKATQINRHVSGSSGRSARGLARGSSGGLAGRSTG
jgi:hypothetical protein